MNDEIDLIDEKNGSIQMELNELNFGFEVK